MSMFLCEQIQISLNLKQAMVERLDNCIQVYDHCSIVHSLFEYREYEKDTPIYLRVHSNNM